MELDAANQNGTDHHRDNNAIHNSFPYGDVHSMLLSEEERDWGLEIKEALRQASCRDEEIASTLQNISDMEIAQLAIVKYRGNLLNGVEQIIDTANKMRYFREFFNIQDTVSDGMQSLEALMQQQPGLILDVSYLPSEGCWHTSYDLSKIDPSVIVRSPDQYRTFQAGCYYQMLAASADFRGIRTGAAILSECDGMGFGNFDARVFEKFCLEFWNFYPMNYKQTVCKF